VIGFFFEIHTSGLSSLPACTRSAMPRHGRTNAIAESEAYDHAYQKFHLRGQKKGPGGCALSWP
jgi:hypothetical protein